MIKYTAFLILIILFSCNYKFHIKTIPEDALITINGKKCPDNRVYVSTQKNIEIFCHKRGHIDYKNNFKKFIPIGIKRINIKLKTMSYSIEIDTIEGTSDIIIDSKNIGTTPLKLKLDYGIHNMILSRPGYSNQEFRLEAKRDGKILFRHQKKAAQIKQVGIFKCKSLPKQVIFSPDSNYVFIPILDGYGFQIFNIDTLSIDNYVKAPCPANTKGFVEGLFIEEKNVFWIAQMETGKIYEYSYPEVEYKRTIDTKGIWSKFMAWSPVLQVVAISNWVSNDISIIRYSSGRIIKKIATSPAPRGLVFSRDGSYLYATTFDGGKIYKIKTKKWKEEKHIYKENAAMRHTVLSADDSTLYVSNMYHNEIYQIDTDDFIINYTYKVNDNPNTISLTPDNKYLYVSSRGPNSNTYLTHSPHNGRITIIDLKKKKIASSIDGGNQPTGLDISKDGNYLCFSNFRDNNIELYWIQEGLK